MFSWRRFNLLVAALFLVGGFFISNVVIVEAVEPDTTAPTLTITDFTANSEPMRGSVEDGYTLNTDGNSSTQYLIQFYEDSGASEDLDGGADDTIGLFLQPTGVQTATLVSYYSTKPEEYRTYLNAAAAGTLPFAFIFTNGTAIQLLDGAMKAVAHENTDMNIPGDFPGGTYTLKGTITDTAVPGNSTAVTFKLIVVAPDTTAPTLTITGFTANSEPMSGSLAGGYTLNTDGNSSTQYQIQFTGGSIASEDLEDNAIELFLQPTGEGQTADLVSYYRTKPEEYQTYLNDAAAGNQPFAFIKTGGTAIQILDGERYALAGTNTDMIIPGDFPAGTYTLTGSIPDLAGNETEVTYILNVVGPVTSSSGGSRARPVVQTVAVAPAVTPATPTTSATPGEVLGAEDFTFSLFLKMGSSNNNEVMELQKFLNGAGHGTLVVDGKFGKLTKAALIKFQLANGLVGDGVVGPLTRAVLNK